MVREALRNLKIRAKCHEALLEALRPRDTGKRRDISALQVLERLAVVRVVEIAQVERLVACLDNFRGAIVFADALDQLRISFRWRFRDEDVAGAAEICGRLAQGAAW